MAIARILLIALGGLLMGANLAYPQAVLLFDNGPANFVGGYEMTGSTVADDFELAFGAQASRVSFALLDATCTFPANWDGHLRWWIYLDDGGVPGAYVASGFAPSVSATKVFDNCPAAAHYSVTFPLGQLVSLSSGTRYWLALHMAADWSVTQLLYWGTTTIGHYSSGVSLIGGIGTWGSVGLEHSFWLAAVGDDTYIFCDGFESGDTSLWSLTEP